jgi:hypothetical protein
VGPVSQAIEAHSPVPGNPPVHGLPGDAVSFSDLDDRSTGQDLHNRAHRGYICPLERRVGAGSGEVAGRYLCGCQKSGFDHGS